MLQLEIIYLIDKTITRTGRVRKQEILDVFEISTRTFARAIEFMRDRLSAPIEYTQPNGEEGWYYYNDKFQLPGMWFTISEINGLMILNQKYKETHPKLWNEDLKLLDIKLKEMLSKYGHYDCINKLLAKK